MMPAKAMVGTNNTVRNTAPTRRGLRRAVVGDEKTHRQSIVRNTAPTRRGLRRDQDRRRIGRGPPREKHRPDEKGIETNVVSQGTSLQIAREKHRPDEKGIET